MEHRIANPWTWQDAYGFVQGHEVSGAQRVLFCAGQTSNDADGNPLHAGDMRAQVNQAFDNLDAVLTEAGRRTMTSEPRYGAGQWRSACHERKSP